MRLSAQSAHASYTRAQCFPLNTHPSRDERSLTARGPVRGSPRRARSFGYCLSSRARSTVSRDGDRRFIRFTIKAWSLAVLCGYAPFSQPARHKSTPLSAVNIFRRYLSPFLLWAVPRTRNKRYANYRFKAISSRLGIGRVRVFGCGRGCGV